jgi:hypothetical protein
MNAVIQGGGENEENEEKSSVEEQRCCVLLHMMRTGTQFTTTATLRDHEARTAL